MDKSKTNNLITVTYMYPMLFVVNPGEEFSISLDEVNNLSYNYTLLNRIIGKIDNTFNGSKEEFYICCDGAVCPINKTIQDVELSVNDLFCKLRLGGLRVDAVNSRDFTTGGLEYEGLIYPVNFGESWNTHLHANLRMRMSGTVDAIHLWEKVARCLTIRELIDYRKKGEKIVSSISNISTYHLINGITEYEYHNWNASLTYLWIVIEELVDWLWEKRVIDCIGESDISKSRISMLEDHRTYTTSVKQEVLYQRGILDFDLYSDLFQVRQARNKLIHEGRIISMDIAAKVYNCTEKMLCIASGETVKL